MMSTLTSKTKPREGLFIATEILAPHPIYLSLICCSGFCWLVYIQLDQASP